MTPTIPLDATIARSYLFVFRNLLNLLASGWLLALVLFLLFMSDAVIWHELGLLRLTLDTLGFVPVSPAGVVVSIGQQVIALALASVFAVAVHDMILRESPTPNRKLPRFSKTEGGVMVFAALAVFAILGLETLDAFLPMSAAQMSFFSLTDWLRFGLGVFVCYGLLRVSLVLPQWIMTGSVDLRRVLRLTRGNALRLFVLFVAGPAPLFLITFLLGLACADHVSMLLEAQDPNALPIGFAVYFSILIPIFGLNIALGTALLCFSYKALISQSEPERPEPRPASH